MRQYVLALALVAAAFLPLNLAESADPGPQFRLGFKALADQIIEVVGTPLEDEHYAANGDSLQQTTTGLMAWRKADNWTAFTDGSRTWVNGPQGVQDRPNDMRFVWEKDLSNLVPAPAQPQPSPTVTATPISALVASATPAPTPALQPMVAERAAQVREHLRTAVTTFGTHFFAGASAPPTALYPLGNGYSRFLVKQYLQGIVSQARGDDTLAMYLLWTAPALDVSTDIHVWLLQERFLDRFSRSIAETGAPPLQVLSLLTPRERQIYDLLKRDGDFSTNGARNCSPYLYTSLR